MSDPEPQDTKNKYIPHRAYTYYFITSAWSVYCAFTQLFVIFIAFSQLDLLLFRLASDLMANYFTLSMYLHGKIHDPQMHALNANHAPAPPGSDTDPCHQVKEEEMLLKP